MMQVLFRLSGSSRSGTFTGRNHGTLRRLPKGVEFLGRAIFKAATAGVDGFLDLLEPLYEFGSTTVQEFLRLQFLEPRQIYSRK